MKAQLIYLTGKILKILNIGFFLTNKYNDANLVTAEFELIQDEIDIDSIENYKQEHKERCIDIDIRNKINELVQAVKQLNKKLEVK